MLQPERGQVKVATYANSGLLTVHVIQARNLQSKWNEKCNAYIKVTLHPEDNDQSTKCKTEVVSDCNQPKFDEKFSFELLEEDLKKRILVSAWHHEEDTGHNEFLGCMSFGIQHIVSHRRIVNGWYYLLTEKLGKRKHLQVGSHKNANADYDLSVPKVNQELACMEPYVFVLKKEAEEDHGIEVTGAFPAIVKDITPGCPAESIGLQTGDRIVRINGFNVSRSTEESVARILRSCDKQIILEIQRPRTQGRGKPIRTKAHHRSIDIQEALDEDNYMDQASLLRARMHHHSSMNISKQQAEMQFNAHMQALAMQQQRESMCDGGTVQDFDNRSVYSIDHANGHRSNMYESLPSINMNVPNHHPHHNNALLQLQGRVLSQKSINVNVEDGYYSEGQPTQRMHTKMIRDGGYMSDSRSMSLRRTSTRTPANFRENGYYSEGQPMRRRSTAIQYQAIPEDDIYIDEEDMPHQHLQQQSINQGRIVDMSALHQSRTQSRGVTASSYHDGYCSEGQPMAAPGRNRMPAPIAEEAGYYSEGGKGMRMKVLHHPQRSMNMSQRQGGSVHNVGHHQVMTREQLEQMYHQGGEFDNHSEEHPHDHDNGCPFHINNQHLQQHQQQQMYQQPLQMGGGKRDKVAAWLDNIPHPKDMTPTTTENPFPELANGMNHANSKVASNKEKGHDNNKLHGLGLDPIYEEPECSVSMLTHKRHQLEPIHSDRDNNNKENKPKSSGTGGVKLFSLCGGIAAKKKKKKAISC